MNTHTFIMISKSDLEEVIHDAALQAIKKFSEHAIKPNGSHDSPMTTEEAAKFLDLKVSTLYTKVSNREIAFCKKGKKLYFLRDDLVNYISTGRKSSEDEIDENIGNYMAKPKKETNINNKKTLKYENY